MHPPRAPPPPTLTWTVAPARSPPSPKRKVKSFIDDEALVVGHEAGKKRLKGLVGALACRTRTGVRFKVGSGFTDAQRADDEIPPVGSVVTFR